MQLSYQNYKQKYIRIYNQHRDSQILFFYNNLINYISLINTLEKHASFTLEEYTNEVSCRSNILSVSEKLPLTVKTEANRDIEKLDKLLIKYTLENLEYQNKDFPYNRRPINITD